MFGLCDGSVQEFRKAAALALIYHLAGARCSNLSASEYLKQKVTSTSNDPGLKSSHKWLTCPLWKYHKYHNSSCVCGSGIDNVVYCEDNQSTISIVSCYCMSHSGKNLMRDLKWLGSSLNQLYGYLHVLIINGMHLPLLLKHLQLLFYCHM